MNPNTEEYTEQVLQDSKEDLLKKYALVEPTKKRPVPNMPKIPFGKTLVFIGLFIVMQVCSLYQLPVYTASYPQNIFNYLTLYATLLWSSMIPFTIGWEWQKYIQKHKNLKEHLNHE